MANYGAGAAGALTGAATGATLGSWIPGIGTGVGAIGGGLLGGLTGLFGGDKNNVLTGSPGQYQTTQNFTPQQQNVQNQTLQQLQQLIGQQGRPDYSGFEPIEQRARQQFATQTIPSLAERFTSLGGSGTRASGGSLRQYGYGAELEGQLAALRSQYGLGQQQLQQNRLSQLSNIGFQPSFERQYIPGEPGAIREFLPYLIKAVTQKYGPSGLQELVDLLKNQQPIQG